MQTPEATPAQTLEVLKLSIAVVGFFVGVVSIILVYIQMRKTHEWNRRKASHDALSEFQTGRTVEARLTLYVVFGVEFNTSQTYADIEAKASEDDRRTLRFNTFQLLNYLEVLCLGIKNHVLDEDICYDMMRFTLKKYWLWAQPLIEATRKEAGDEMLWIEVENYARRWLKRGELDKEQYLDRIRIPGKRPT